MQLLHQVSIILFFICFFNPTGMDVWLYINKIKISILKDVHILLLDVMALDVMAPDVMAPAIFSNVLRITTNQTKC